MSRKKATVTRGDGDEPVKILASEITKIAEATRKMMAGGLKPRTIYLLVSKSSGVGQRQVERVLDACQNLQFDYLEEGE